jgi:K+-sensing histidine kinase KdpD
MERTSELNGNPPTPATYFAPPERMEEKEVARLSEFVKQDPLFQAVLESIDGYLMILNPQRQLLAANRELLSLLGIESPTGVLGNRPGEAIHCIHAPNGPSGCGTAKACASCGAVLAILTSMEAGHSVINECLATVGNDEQTDSLEFRVRSTPVRVGGHDFVVLVFNDISGEKRRDALERTFFHDILNTIGGLMGWSGLLHSTDALDPKETAVRIVELSRRLKQEIEDQRRLLQAEKGDLELEVETFPVREVFDTMETVFSVHSAAKGKKFETGQAPANEVITTDRSLLVRVLTNMAKNAFEAIDDGETVRLDYERRDGRPVFSIHNPGAIPDQVALRIFQRSFSTKAKKGRGIGTYSMKLFGERYLGGKVGFETGEPGGTTFFIELPEREPVEVSEGSG